MKMFRFRKKKSLSDKIVSEWLNKKEIEGHITSKTKNNVTVTEIVFHTVPSRTMETN